jgi:hypothetical protein
MQRQGLDEETRTSDIARLQSELFDTAELKRVDVLPLESTLSQLSP